MKELIIGLLGGGVAVQLLNLIINARPNRRQLTAKALDSEISALEHTLKILSDNVESQARIHAAERQELQREIERLRHQVAELTDTVATLRAENAKMRIKAGKLLS